MQSNSVAPVVRIPPKTVSFYPTYKSALPQQWKGNSRSSLRQSKQSTSSSLTNTHMFALIRCSTTQTSLLTNTNCMLGTPRRRSCIAHHSSPIIHHSSIFASLTDGFIKINSQFPCCILHFLLKEIMGQPNKHHPSSSRPPT